MNALNEVVAKHKANMIYIYKKNTVPEGILTQNTHKLKKVQGSEKVETLKSAFITLMGKQWDEIKFWESNVGQQGYSSLRDFDLLYELGEGGQRRHRGT